MSKCVCSTCVNLENEALRFNLRKFECYSNCRKCRNITSFRCKFCSTVCCIGCIRIEYCICTRRVAFLWLHKQLAQLFGHNFYDLTDYI